MSLFSPCFCSELRQWHPRAGALSRIAYLRPWRLVMTFSTAQVSTDTVRIWNHIFPVQSLSLCDSSQCVRLVLFVKDKEKHVAQAQSVSAASVLLLQKLAQVRARQTQTARSLFPSTWGWTGAVRAEHSACSRWSAQKVVVITSRYYSFYTIIIDKTPPSPNAPLRNTQCSALKIKITFWGMKHCTVFVPLAPCYFQVRLDFYPFSKL